jgi:peptide chain release factor 1
MNNNPYQTQINQISTKIQENQKILSDPDLGDLAQQEIKKLQQQLETLKKAAADYQESLEEQEEAQKKPTAKSSAILELRAGAGGDEAKIWANDLLRMYTRYCQNKGLEIEFIDDLVIKISHSTKLKLAFTDPQTSQEQALEKTFYPYELLKHESGVHRVQRVPTTETQGRIHTSTASVAILPEIKSHAIKIRDEDLRWEFMRSSGAGGQSVNKTSSAVRLTHEPSGIVVRVSQERKQLQNRAIALELLRSQLWTIEEEKRVNKIENARSAIGRNMRAEKIRTYNFPQNRVTDHRINESWHQLDSILEGELDPIITTIKQKLILEENKFSL